MVRYGAAADMGSTAAHAAGTRPQLGTSQLALGLPPQMADPRLGLTQERDCRLVDLGAAEIGEIRNLRQGTGHHGQRMP